MISLNDLTNMSWVHLHHRKEERNSGIADGDSMEKQDCTESMPCLKGYQLLGL